MGISDRRRHRRAAIAWIATGLAAQGLGLALADSPGVIGALGFFSGIAAAAALVWGTAHLVYSKGWTPWLGLIGLLSIVGVLVAILLWEVQRERQSTDSTEDASPPRDT